ncbi:hypothetical protein ABW19_dt0203787 [Dactylella cylindrospora]|nr:hypothetical protein ABW19_dt0203787 [Dactylella cylindrospora]
MAAGSNVALGTSTTTVTTYPSSSSTSSSSSVKPYRNYPELDSLLASLGLLDPDPDPSLSEEEDEFTMLRTFIIPSKTLSSLSKQALFVASAKDIRDHFPSRNTIDPSNGLHTLSRPTSTALSKPNRVLIFPQNLRQQNNPAFLYGSPSPGPSYTNRATDPDPEPTPTPTSTPENTTITDSEDLPSRAFQYNISVSYVSKHKKWEPSNTFNFSPYNRMSFESNWMKRKRGRPKTGQDAFFVSRVSDTGAVAFGVADGVGGYAESGIDSADFSHTLCEDMAEVAYNSEVPMRADRLLEAGYVSACSNPNLIGGGSTACIAVAKPDGTMETANLGDSGFIILRCGRVHRASDPQTHGFNTPYQLSIIQQETIDQARKYGGPVPLSDRPRDAILDFHDLQHGDVLIFATDGLWDNVSAQDVLGLVSEEMISTGGWVESDSGIKAGPNLGTLVDEEVGPSLQGNIARAIAQKAKSLSINQKVDGPFAKEIQKYFPGEVYHGGKRDDICVLCCVVVEWNVPSSKSGIGEPRAVPTPVAEEQGARGLPGGGGPGAPMPRL